MYLRKSQPSNTHCDTMIVWFMECLIINSKLLDLLWTTIFTLYPIPISIYQSINFIYFHCPPKHTTTTVVRPKYCHQHFSKRRIGLIKEYFLLFVRSIYSKLRCNVFQLFTIIRCDVRNDDGKWKVFVLGVEKNFVELGFFFLRLKLLLSSLIWIWRKVSFKKKFLTTLAHDILLCSSTWRTFEVISSVHWIVIINSIFLSSDCSVFYFED